MRAIDPTLGRDALGAAVQVRAGGRSQMRPVLSSTSYLMAIEPEAHFGLGDAERFDGITVVWPDGTREEFPGGPADRVMSCVKGEGEPSRGGGRAARRPRAVPCPPVAAGRVAVPSLSPSGRLAQTGPGPVARARSRA